MNRFIASALAIFAASVSAQPVAWPGLPNEGFITGHAATQDDVKSGIAVFVAARDGQPIGKPLSIRLPQYAWYLEAGKKHAAIVIQAEEADGRRIFGARLLTGEYIAGLESDFALLGTRKPE